MSLRARLLIAMLAAVAAAIGWFAWWEADALRPRSWTIMEEGLVDTANVLAAAVGERSADGPDTGWLAQAWAVARAAPPQAVIDGIAKDRLALEVSITDRHGTCLLDTAHPGDVGRDNSQWNDVLRTLRGEYGARATRTDPADSRTTWLHVAVPIRHDGALIGVLTVAKPIAAAVPQARGQRVALVLAAVVIGGAVAGMALALTAWITTPLARLTAQVRAAADGRRVPPADLGRGEIAELGRAFADLRERVEGRAWAEEYVQHLTHELKSPLAGLAASAELLQEDLPPADRQRFAGAVRAEAARLNGIVERLLSLAHLERREVLAADREVDLAATAAAVAGELEAKARASGATITVDGAGTVRGDGFLLAQAVTNLLDNALAAGGGAIEVVLEPGRLTVRDRGRGIPAFALPRLGERFFSLPDPRTGRKGTGLGLAFVREIARLHGATLHLANREGGGAEAELRFAG